MGMIINPYNFKVPLLLDTYTGAAAAYSLRKLRTAYTGYCIEVRRSSDDTTQNIGFVNNVLDESALTTFCGAGDGFVKTWYDQSGNGNNLSQSTLTFQPSIVISGSVINDGSKPSISSPGVKELSVSISINQPDTFFTVAKKGSDADNQIMDSDGTRQLIRVYGSSNDNHSIYAGSYLSVGGSTSNLFLLYGLFNGADSEISVNGNDATIGNAGTGEITILYIFSKWSSRPWIGLISEFIIYDTDQSSNKSAIKSNINSFYSIY